MKAFDRKFGADFVAELPSAPAVYLFKDGADRILYVGKAKDVRRRLGSYRNASRRKAHRKMRAIVRAAAQLEVRPLATEEEALLLENELIRRHRPALNVEGKYDFLYPAIGLARTPKHALLCFTTSPEAYEAFPFRWFGAFRSRPRAKEAFGALIDLLALIGHLERGVALGERPRLRGSTLRGLRQLPLALDEALEAYLGGRDRGALGALSLALLEKPRARREAAEVQARLRTLAAFFESDLAPLRGALLRAGREGSFVPQAERDALFIQAASAQAASAQAASVQAGSAPAG